MKKIISLLLLIIGVINSNIDAQVFWTETFGTSGASGTHVGAYSGTHGAWTEAILSTEGGSPNPWFVSCDEAGHVVGGCGTDCAGGGYGATLHIGPDNLFAGPDGGAMYDAGGLCSSIYCVNTDRRAQSPTINCTGHSNIRLKFYYIENGQGTTDDGTVWYYDGTTWSFLFNPAKTGLCGFQGKWDTTSYLLPASANGNPNVKIGFRWVNNDDAVGTDPSFAIDSITLSAASAVPVAAFTASRDTVCQDSCIIFTNTSTSTGTIDSFRWSIVGFPYTLAAVSPLTLCMTSTIPPGTYTMRLDAFGGGGFDSATRNFTVKPAPHPVITKAAHVLSVAGTYLNYQWYNGSSAITGATNASYTYTVSGTFSVKVDSGGCKGTSTALSTVGVPIEGPVENKFWTSQPSGNVLSVNAEQYLAEDFTISISDQSGRLMISELWVHGIDNKQIAIEALSPGLYIIRIGNKQAASVLKWIKQ
jgi:hypothetical protein